MPDRFPLKLLLVTFAGWVNRQQADAIAYLREENRVLKKQLRGRRLRLTDAQRRRLAAKGKALGRRLLGTVATIVTPDTILRWHLSLPRMSCAAPRPASERERSPVWTGGDRVSTCRDELDPPPARAHQRAAR